TREVRAPRVRRQLEVEIRVAERVEIDRSDGGAFERDEVDDVGIVAGLQAHPRIAGAESTELRIGVRRRARAFEQRETQRCRHGALRAFGDLRYAPSSSGNSVVRSTPSHFIVAR